LLEGDISGNSDGQDVLETVGNDVWGRGYKYELTKNEKMILKLTRVRTEPRGVARELSHERTNSWVVDAEGQGGNVANTLRELLQDVLRLDVEDGW
jgi:hypothetical protein